MPKGWQNFCSARLIMMELITSAWTLFRFSFAADGWTEAEAEAEEEEGQGYKKV